MPSRAFAERYRDLLGSAGIRRSTCRRTSSRPRPAPRSGRRTRRRSARRRCARRSRRSSRASSAGTSIPSATCSSRSAGCRASTSPRSASAAGGLARAVLLLSAGRRSDGRRVRCDGRRGRVARLGRVRRRDRRGDDARDREHAGQPDRIRLPAARPRRDRRRARAAPMRCSCPTRRTPGSSTTATSTSRRGRIRSCATARSSCAASRRPTRWPPGASASPLGRRAAIDAMARAFAVAGARDRRRRPGGRARRADRPAGLDRGRPAPSSAEMRPRAIEAANATGVLRAGCRRRRVRLGRGRRRRGRVERPARRRRTDHGAPGPPLRRGDAAPPHPVRRPRPRRARRCSRGWHRSRTRSDPGVRHRLPSRAKVCRICNFSSTALSARGRDGRRETAVSRAARTLICRDNAEWPTLRAENDPRWRRARAVDELLHFQCSLRLTEMVSDTARLAMTARPTRLPA